MSEAEAEAMIPCGGLITWGCLGTHLVQLLAYPAEAKAVAVVCDGRHRRPRTLAGIRRGIAERRVA